MLKKSLIRTILVGILFPGVLLAQAILEPQVKEETHKIEFKIKVVETSVRAWDNGMEGLLGYLKRELISQRELPIKCDREETSFGGLDTLGGLSMMSVGYGIMHSKGGNPLVGLCLSAVGTVYVFGKVVFTGVRYDDVVLDLLDSCGRPAKRIVIKKTTKADREEIEELLLSLTEEQGCVLENLQRSEKEK